MLFEAVSIASSKFCGSFELRDAFVNLAKVSGEESEAIKLSLCFYLSWQDNGALGK